VPASQFRQRNGEVGPVILRITNSIPRSKLLLNAHEPSASAEVNMGETQHRSRITSNSISHSAAQSKKGKDSVFRHAVDSRSRYAQSHEKLNAMRRELHVSSLSTTAGTLPFSQRTPDDLLAARSPSGIHLRRSATLRPAS